MFEREERLPVTKAEVEELVLRAVTTKINQCLQKASETTAKTKREKIIQKCIKLPEFGDWAVGVECARCQLSTVAACFD